MRSLLVQRALVGVTFGVAAFASLAALGERSARANGYEIPENGTEVMGRAGAWTARADNPLAAAFNPAGLAGQPTAILVNSNLTWQSFCFERSGTYASGGNNGGTVFQGQNYAGQPYPEVCKKNGIGDVNVVPQIAFNYHASDKLGVSFAIVTPSSAGKSSWPDRVNLPSGDSAPAPQRYLLLEANGVVLSPTLAAGYEVAKGVRFGAAFQATMAFLNFSNVSHSLNSSAADAAESPNGDLRADLKVKKLFTPAIILGALISPTDSVDIGGMFRWSADIKASSDVTTTGGYYGNGNGVKNTPVTSSGSGDFVAPQPWEVRLGVRYHPMRKDAKVVSNMGRRDFLASDAFDLELDGTYAHNKSFDTLTITFPAGQCVALPGNGCPNFLPPDASVPHGWRDSVGVRLGGEYVAVPDRLGIRAGAFYQNNGQDPKYAAIDFLPSSMFGLYLGATLRLSKTVDLAGGFGHIFLHGLNNNGEGGVYGITAVQRPDPGVCPAGASPPDYRTCVPVNGGKVTGGYNMLSIGATFHL